MKTIKQVDVFEADRQIKRFFSQIGLTQIIFTVSVVGYSLMRFLVEFLSAEVKMHASQTHLGFKYGFWSFLTILNGSDVICVQISFAFLFFCLCWNQKENNTEKEVFLYWSLFLSEVFYFNKSGQIITSLHYAIKSLCFESYPTFNDTFHFTSSTNSVSILVPLQFLFAISVSQAFLNPQQITYFCAKPFQIKSAFKPFIYIILFQAFSLKVDIFISTFVEIFFLLSKADLIICKMAKNIDRKCPKILFKLQKIRYLHTVSASQPQFKELDTIKSNNSDILEEK